jgi:hypothetical protein
MVELGGMLERVSRAWLDGLAVTSDYVIVCVGHEAYSGKRARLGGWILVSGTLPRTWHVAH